MIYDDILEKIRLAEFPTSFPNSLNIGTWDAEDNRSDALYEFSPSDMCSAFANVHNYQDNASVTVRSHGVEVVIDNVRVNIHNSQIISFDCFYIDDTFEYQRSENRGSRVGLGLLLAGPVGAAVGLASSFGKTNRHIKCHCLVIAYWNIETKDKEIIWLENTKGVNDNVTPKMVEYWQEQVKINEETGRQPKGNKVAGIEDAGCFSVLLPFIFLGFYACYKVIEQVLW